MHGSATFFAVRARRQGCCRTRSQPGVPTRAGLKNARAMVPRADTLPLRLHAFSPFRSVPGSPQQSAPLQDTSAVGIRQAACCKGVSRCSVQCGSASRPIAHKPPRGRRLLHNRLQPQAIHPNRPTRPGFQARGQGGRDSLQNCLPAEVHRGFPARTPPPPAAL